MIKSWKLADCEDNTKTEYKTVTNISNDITCTSPLIVDNIAYLDWLSIPTIEKNMLENNIITKWYKTIESTDSKIYMLGPQIKFKPNNNCAINVRDKNIGAATVVGLGIIKSSLVKSLNKSATIWKAPFRPSKVGPILLWENAKSFLSVKITKRVKTIVTTEIIRLNSWIVFFWKVIYISAEIIIAKKKINTKLYIKRVIDSTDETLGNSK